MEAQATQRKKRLAGRVWRLEALRECEAIVSAEGKHDPVSEQNKAAARWASVAPDEIG